MKNIYGYNNRISEPYEWWNDEDLISELDRRSAELKSGNVKGISLEESKAYLLASLNNEKTQ
jgi:hypothetical protein